MGTRITGSLVALCAWQLIVGSGLLNADTTMLAADGCSESCCCANDGIYFSVDGLFLDRTTRGSRPVIIEVQDEASVFPGATLLTANDLNYDWNGGLRVLVGWQQDACSAWEASYFGIFDWNASAVIEGANSLAIPGDLGLASLDFFAADRMEITYRSRLHSAEANYLSTTDNLALLGGFRYLSLNEDFNIRATDLDTGTSDYQIQSTNNLFGGQVGGRYFSICDSWGWEATAKAGLFGNAANQSQSVSDFPPGFFLRSRTGASGGQLAFVGDVNLSGFYQLDDVWSLRAGYNLLWIEGVALATDQLDFTDTADSGTSLNSTGGLFAHGVSIGIQAIR